MSGFGIRAFKKHTLEKSQEVIRNYIPHIVMGENYWSVLTFLKLRNKFGADKVKFITPNHYDKQSILNEWKCSVGKLRDENTASILRDINPRLEIFPSTEEVLFYKDSKFHEIGGRAKPLTLLEDEEFYTQKSFNYKLENLFNDEEWNSLDDILGAEQVNKFVSKINLTTPKDLVEKTNFILTTGEAEEYHCEKLYYTQSPKSFFKLISNKNELDDGIAAYCTSLEERAALSIHFLVDREVHDKKQTVLLPQSQTHEWGHFIVDFDAYDPSIKKQEFRSTMFIQLDEVNEEELAKKVRLLKRTIERTFPEFAKARITEHIHFDSEFLIKTTDDFDAHLNNTSDIHFVGIGAPTNRDNGEWNSLVYEARAICSLSDLLAD
tara:strand:- start:726 stop:1862 length:1137 start_codon:yes stop_codon:yes gene_type:complete